MLESYNQPSGKFAEKMELKRRSQEVQTVRGRIKFLQRKEQETHKRIAVLEGKTSFA